MEEPGNKELLKNINIHRFYLWLFILTGYYLLATSNPDVSNWEIHQHYMCCSCIDSLFQMHTCTTYSTFQPMGVALSACLSWSPLPSEWIALSTSEWNSLTHYGYCCLYPTYIHTQFSRCDVGVLSCTSLLTHFLHHLPGDYTVYRCQLGKLVH